MKVLVCGGRDFKDWILVCYHLNEIHKLNPITELIEGGAKGADYLARHWCVQSDVKNVTYKADWKTHGKSAGPIRNIFMLEDSKPDMVVAFPGGKGTAHMVKIAKEAGVEVKEISDV